MKFKVICIVFMFVVCFVRVCAGEDFVCFSEKDVKEVLKKIEESETLRLYVESCEERCNNFELIVGELKHKEIILNEKVKSCEKTIDELVEVVEEQKSVLKTAKKSGFGRYLEVLGYFGLGVLVGLFLL